MADPTTVIGDTITINGEFHSMPPIDMAQAIITLQEGGDSPRFFDLLPGPGVDGPDLKALDIVGNPHDAMGIYPPDLGMNQGIGGDPTVLSRNAPLLKDFRHQI